MFAAPPAAAPDNPIAPLLPVSPLLLSARLQPAAPSVASAIRAPAKKVFAFVFIGRSPKFPALMHFHSHPLYQDMPAQTRRHR
ncbi:hypothetical protein SB861_49995 [Paraburkholderia sp. SIMBA_049]